MRIITGTLAKQPQEFIDMVSNAKPGNLYIHSYPSSIIFSYDANGAPQPAIFIADAVEDIKTRFGSRDRILKGGRYKFDKNNENLIFVEKTSVWCSQLADTEAYTGKFNILK